MACDDLLVGFITDVRSYLSRALRRRHAGRASPVFRNSLAGRLGTIIADATVTEGQKQALTAQVVDAIVTELDRGFGAVTNSYLALRTKMTG